MRKTLTVRKRNLHLVARPEKVAAVKRVLIGESRADVRASIGVPESTLRGWLKTQDIFDEALKLLRDTGTTITRWDSISPVGNRCYKDRAGSDGTVSDSSDMSSGHVEEIFSNLRFPWTSDNHMASGKGSSVTLKRKRNESNSSEDDLPVAKRRRFKEHASSNEVSNHDNQQVNELESRHWKELLYELVKKDALSHDLFVYILEMLQ